jgi:hypothetical protein
MNIPLMDKRVRSLEEMMADLIATSENTSRIVAQTSIEMAAFKEEMQEDRRHSKDEMAAFKEEMREFRDKMDQDSHERKLEQLRFNRELGDIAHKQGRMTEDLVAPSICRILREALNLPESCGCNRAERIGRFNSKNRQESKEFDVIAECEGYVLVTQTKSTPNAKDIAELKETIREFRDYFPEYTDKKLLGCLATLYAHESLIKRASREGILILAVGEELMDVMNEPGFKPTEF